MSEPVSRAVVEAFYKAYAERDVDGVAQFLADDVKWTISGPVDVLPFCGTRHGKAAVLDLITREVPAVFSIHSFLIDAMLVDGDRAATLARLSAHFSDGRIISYRLSHFARFRDGKVIENLSLIDSFDAVEQVLGHSLTGSSVAASQGDLIAV